MPVGIGTIFGLAQEPQVVVVARYGSPLLDTPVVVQRTSSPVVEWRLLDRLTGAQVPISPTGRVELSLRASLVDPLPGSPTKSENDGTIVVTSRAGGVLQVQFDAGDTADLGTTCYRLDVVDADTRTAIAKGPFVVGV